MPDTTKITIRLSVKLIKAAKIAAIERDVDLQDLVEQGLRLMLKRRPGPRRRRRA
jgi:hypothetical protein